VKLLVDARVGWGHGIGRVIGNTLPRIARLRPDWQIGVLVGPTAIAMAEDVFAGTANLTIIPCPIEPFSLAEQVSLSGYAKEYDLTWFTNYWVPLHWQGRFVATVHDMLHLIPEYFPASKPRRMLSKQVFNKVRRDATTVMFVSRFTQQAFVESIGVPRRSEIIHLGGDHLNYGTPRPMGDRKRQLMVVAASKKHKNFPLLLEAWRQAKTPPDWSLVIVSPGSALKSSVDIEEMASSVERTTVRRGLSNESLTELYRESSILLMPSLYEGFGLPLLEGLLAGNVCISSNAGAMVEVAEGSLVQFVNGNDLKGWINTIEATCDSIDRGECYIDQVIQHNLLQAQRFRWDHSAEKIATALQHAAL